MKRYNMPVHEALRPFLRYCVVKTISNKGAEPLKNKTHADLWPSLVVLKGPAIEVKDCSGTFMPVPRVTFMGASRIPGEFSVPDGSQVIGFNFQPGKAHPFFGSGLDEFTDRIVPVSDAWGAEGRVLEDRIAEAKTPLAVKKVVEEAFIRRLERFEGFPSALPEPLEAALDAQGTSSVADLARKAGCSARHLKRLFDQWVGLSPKLFSRITRFQALTGRLTDPAQADWVGLANDHGYFDQSHLIRDFSDFAGLTPMEFLKSAASWTAMQPQGFVPSPE